MTPFSAVICRHGDMAIYCAQCSARPRGAAVHDITDTTQPPPAGDHRPGAPDAGVGRESADGAGVDGWLGAHTGTGYASAAECFANGEAVCSRVGPSPTFTITRDGYRRGLRSPHTDTHKRLRPDAGADRDATAAAGDSDHPGSAHGTGPRAGDGHGEIRASRLPRRPALGLALPQTDANGDPATNTDPVPSLRVRRTRRPVRGGWRMEADADTAGNRQWGLVTP